MATLPDPINRSIANFFSWVEDHLGVVMQLRNGQPEADRGKIILFQKSLLLSLIDTISIVPFPLSATNQNRQRFVKFIKDFGQWDDAEKVSLPHIYAFARKIPDPNLSDLREFAKTRLGGWLEGDRVFISTDPQLNEVARFFRSDWNQLIDKNHPLARITAETFSHAHLLWNLRNSLVHESDGLGYGMELPDETTGQPYYHVMGHSPSGEMELIDQDTLIRINSGVVTWELVYPLRFIERLARNGTGRLREYCESHRIRPHDSFKFGSYWIQALNE